MVALRAPHLLAGQRGEEAAARHLKGLGYRVLERNLRTRHGELDLVCRHGDVLVFVEVKTRKAGSLAAPHEALTLAKRRRLARAAAEYLSGRDLWGSPCRFDLVEVVAPGTTGQAVRVIANAFDLGDLGGQSRGWQPW